MAAFREQLRRLLSKHRRSCLGLQIRGQLVRSRLLNHTQRSICKAIPRLQSLVTLPFRYHTDIIGRLHTLHFVLVESDIWIRDPPAFEKLNMDLRRERLSGYPSLLNILMCRKIELSEYGWAQGSIALLPEPVLVQLKCLNLRHERGGYGLGDFKRACMLSLPPRQSRVYRSCV